MSRRPLGAAVVGAGYWGPNLARNLARHPDTELRWIVDTDSGRASCLAAMHGTDVRCSTDLTEALDDPGTEAVVIATPPGTHLELGLACMEAGRHVLVEKPLATSHADGVALVDAAASAGVRLMCDHTFCFTPAVRKMRQLVDDGHLGEPLYVDSTRVNLGLIQSDIDVFWDLAPHDLSILDWVLGEHGRPTGVGAFGADPLGTGRSCVGYLTMPLAGGAVAHCSVSWLSPTKIRQMIVAGSESMVVWDDMKPYNRLMIVDCGVEVVANADEQERERLMVDYRMGDAVIPAISETSEALYDVVGEFAAAIRDDREPCTDGAAGLRVLSVLDSIAASRDANGAVVPVVAR